MIKTELFNEGTLKPAVREYRKFIEKNQHIQIISVNILNNNGILLTYKEA